MSVRIDIGCGGKKRKGFIGLDVCDLPGVDHVVDFERNRLPFADRSVDYIFSSHCFEHLDSPNNIWREISRVAKPGATIEIWTPFVHSDDQWLIGHVSGWSRSRWEHLANSERHFYSANFLSGGFWRWDKAFFCVGQPVRDRLEQAHIPLSIAVDHLVNVVSEWACVFTYCLEDHGGREPDEHYVLSRDEAHSLV